MTIEKLKEYVEDMKKEGLMGYALSIEKMLPELQDRPKEHIMTNTEKDMLEMCQSIADDLELFEMGMVYDTEEMRMVESLEGDYDDERYLDFREYYLWDNYGIRILSDFYDNGLEYRSGSICVATGGPGIWIDTTTGNVEGYWWGERCSVPMTDKVIDMIDRELEDFIEGF